MIRPNHFQVAYESSYAEYEQFNLQPPDVLEELIQRIQAAGGLPSRPLVLSAERDMGRRYLVRSAVFIAGRRGAKARLTVLDLDGYEPKPVERGSGSNDPESSELAKYIAHQLRREPHLRQKLRELLASSNVTVNLNLPSLWIATLFSIGLSLKIPLDKLKELVSDFGDDRHGSARRPADALARILRELSEEAPLVLHVLRAEEITRPFQRFLLDQARVNPRLLLIFSCSPQSSSNLIAPGSRVLRIELPRLDRGEVQDIVDQRFPPGGFDSDLYEALWRYSQGMPGYLATKLFDLRASGVMSESTAGGWRLCTDGEKEAEYIAAFSADLFAPLGAKLEALQPETRDLLWTWLAHAVLCGPFVPARPILMMLGVPSEEMDVMEDHIDELFVDDPQCSIFREARFDHPAFPAMATYEVLPLLGHIVRQRVSPEQLRAAARDALHRLPAFLPIASRGAGVLLLSLAEASEDKAVIEVLARRLSWWIGVEEFESLTELVSEDLARNRLSSDLVWSVINAAHGSWTPFRRLALIDALIRRGEALSLDDAGRLWSLRGAAVVELGDWRAGRECYDRATSLFKMRFGEVHNEAAGSMLNAGVAWMMSGDPAAARSRLTEAVNIFEQLGGEAYEGLGNALNALSQVELMLGDVEAARRAASRALTLADYDQDPRTTLAQGHSLTFLGSLALLNRQPDEAIAFLEQALPYLERWSENEVGKRAMAGCLVSLGDAMSDLNRLREARDHWSRALPLFEEIDPKEAEAIRARLAKSA